MNSNIGGKDRNLHSVTMRPKIEASLPAVGPSICPEVMDVAEEIV